MAAIGGDVFQAEALRLVEVVLDGRHLPGASDGVLGLNGDLRAVVGGTTGIVHDNKPGFVGDFGQDLGRGLPLLVGADELVLLLADLVAGRQLERDIGQAEVLQQAEHETQQVPHLVRGLFGGAVRVRIVLGDRADTGQSLHHAGLLIAVDGTELEQPQWQLAVGAATRRVDEIVHRAVHGLEPVGLTVVVQRREHHVGVVRQVSGGVEELFLGDVRGTDVEEAFVDVAGADIILHHPLDHAALGMKQRQAGAHLLVEAEQVEFGTQLAVVALGGLLHAVLIGLQIVAGRPGGAVDALQLLIALVAAPVGR